MLITRSAEEKFRRISEQTQSGSDLAIERAKASVENAKNQYDRTRELAEKKFVSQGQLGEALSNLSIAQNQLANAQFQAKLNRSKGSDYAIAALALKQARNDELKIRQRTFQREIKAEQSGILTRLLVTLGERVTSDRVLFEITPDGNPLILAQLEAKHARDLKQGDVATVFNEIYPEQHFQAILSAIDPQPHPAQGTLDLVFLVKQFPAYLTQGLGVKLDIEAIRHVDALMIPEAAVHLTGGPVPWVMLANDGRAQRRTLRLGLRSGAKVEVLEGLSEGDFVLLHADTEMVEGKRIRLATAG
jgi:HlyD family secretion protein